MKREDFASSPVHRISFGQLSLPKYRSQIWPSLMRKKIISLLEFARSVQCNTTLLVYYWEWSIRSDSIIRPHELACWNSGWFRPIHRPQQPDITLRSPVSRSLFVSDGYQECSSMGRASQYIQLHMCTHQRHRYYFGWSPWTLVFCPCCAAYSKCTCITILPFLGIWMAHTSGYCQLTEKERR